MNRAESVDVSVYPMKPRNDEATLFRSRVPAVTPNLLPDMAKLRSLLYLAGWVLCAFVPAVGIAANLTVPGRWTEARVNTWAAEHAWPVGANYVPRTAINQLEMWQAATFDLETIDQEFGWASDVGFNAMRVFLHDLLWQQDAPGFLQRIEQFLDVAERHQIKILFVFFDGVWDPHPYLGPQRPPRPFVHNSGWVQSPGREILRDPARHDALKPYVQGVLRRFKDDPRILGWDLFNEPDNPNTDAYGGIELPNKAAAALTLLEKRFGGRARWRRRSRSPPASGSTTMGGSAIRPSISSCWRTRM